MSGVDKSTGIWTLKIAKKRHICDFILAGAIGMQFKPERVADIGCGSGLYCRLFRDGFKWEVVDGYDGTSDIMSLGVYDNIIEADLTKKVDVKEKYDLVICLEVGEHIPPEYEEVLMDNLSSFSSKYLVISWALPGQKSASGHVNCKTNEYVIERFNEKGFKFNKKVSNFLRENSYFGFFKETLMVFVRRGG